MPLISLDAIVRIHELTIPISTMSRMLVSRSIEYRKKAHHPKDIQHHTTDRRVDAASHVHSVAYSW